MQIFKKIIFIVLSLGLTLGTVSANTTCEIDNKLGDTLNSELDNKLDDTPNSELTNTQAKGFWKKHPNLKKVLKVSAGTVGTLVGITFLDFLAEDVMLPAYINWHRDKKILKAESKEFIN